MILSISMGSIEAEIELSHGEFCGLPRLWENGIELGKDSQRYREIIEQRTNELQAAATEELAWCKREYQKFLEEL